MYICALRVSSSGHNIHQTLSGIKNMSSLECVHCSFAYNAHIMASVIVSRRCSKKYIIRVSFHHLYIFFSFACSLSSRLLTMFITTYHCSTEKITCVSHNFLLYCQQHHGVKITEKSRKKYAGILRGCIKKSFQHHPSS